MLRKVKSLFGSQLLALDGDVGKIQDVYIDDAEWIVRYLVVATGGWLSGRKVLISPHAVELIDSYLHSVSVSLTRARVECSPNIDTDKPVSRQHESEFNRYYGYSTYWAGTMQWGNGPLPPLSVPAAADLMTLEERRPSEAAGYSDTHLRSTREVTGYSLVATDGRIGRVEDFLFDDETWALRFLVVDTGPWLLGRRVLITRDYIEAINWAGECVKVRRTRAEVEHGLQCDTQHLPPGDIESALGGNRETRSAGDASGSRVDR
jgi:uncharacterized protein YrrD